jgi:hypothetical protein
VGLTKRFVVVTDYVHHQIGVLVMGVPGEGFYEFKITRGGCHNEKDPYTMVLREVGMRNFS